ncbi:septum formation initiator [Defluviimonas sp. 20V17]|uniref:Cell division protein FtsB n=1 Tax=Allgaiera indica TaxID=765699 RepID=A0AAN4UQX9_9RHOB|nr:septum formation initiator family protein [Allgaiera indica]KDB02814.1 septum formation initiator [Defluviimonas sp. 20V17]GHE01278.1 septum formation initiator precursor [Allgaiera indica]SDW83964.1 Cell division protein FtsB [Allgaiera indica]
MAHSQRRPALGPVIFYSLAFVLASYFTFAAVQGDYGVFRRVRIEADIQQLTAERDQLREELAVLKNKTHRLTDNYLDLDLLDQQVRKVLGYMRADEIVIR